ncbi:hypothetical protein [Desulfurobacterium sp.]
MKSNFLIASEIKNRFCYKAKEKGIRKEVKYFIFEDLLDTGELLIGKKFEVDEFSFITYFLLKKSRNIFRKWDENYLGCFAGFKSGTEMLFEDFSFKIKDFSDFTLLAEAVEVESGNIYSFTLANICDLPKALKWEVPVKVAIFADGVAEKVEEPSSPIEDSCVIRLLKLALKGHGKAIDRLEKVLNIDNASLLLKKVRRNPEEFFRSAILHISKDRYTVIGRAVSSAAVNLDNQELFSTVLETEGVNLAVLLKDKVSEGGRIKITGRMVGYYCG